MGEADALLTLEGVSRRQLQRTEGGETRPHQLAHVRRPPDQHSLTHSGRLLQALAAQTMLRSLEATDH